MSSTECLFTEAYACLLSTQIRALGQPLLQLPDKAQVASVALAFGFQAGSHSGQGDNRSPTQYAKLIKTLD